MLISLYSSFNHPTSDSCMVHLVKLWPLVARWIMPVYAAVHFVPPLLFRRKAVLKEPARYLSRFFIGTLKSSAFLATFVAIYQGLVCYQRHVWFFLQSRGWSKLADLVTHRCGAWLFGFATCLSLFVEEKRRREELALYVLPRALESGWISLRSYGLVPKEIPLGGALWLNVIGVTILMDTWRFDRQALSSLVRNILWQSVGP